MTITAKKINPDGSVVDVPLNDDRKDIDLIIALGGEIRPRKSIAVASAYPIPSVRDSTVMV